MMQRSFQPFHCHETGPVRENAFKPNTSPYFDRLIRRIANRIHFTEEQTSILKNLKAQGPVLYALKNKSRLNALMLREVARRDRLPIPLWSLGEDLSANGFGLASDADVGGRGTGLSVLEDESAVLHLGSPRQSSDPVVEKALDGMIRYQEENTSRPVFLIPLLISYGRRRDRKNENLFNILFGQYDDVGTVRRLITLMRYANQVTMIPSEPLDLRAYLADHEKLSREELCSRLRGDLIGRIDEEHEITVGPLLKSRREFIDLVLQDETFQLFLREKASRERKPVPVLVREARRYLEEIAADYSETFVSLWDKLLTWLWKNIYDGVILDRKGLARVREISRQMPLVVVPCHRSHIDYLLLSYVFYKQNIQLPFVAAGINLSFWPVGYIFRKSGAFFIRRSFKGLDFYAEVFSRYVKTMLQERMPIEFFIEGGRSRTGKMVMPKYGLLSMVLKAWHEGHMTNLGIIPVYIGYDRVIEEKSYVKELEGAAKDGEKATDVIRSRKVVKKRYGHVYVNIGEPILLNDYMRQQAVAYDALDEEARQAFYRKISYEIALAINQVSVITPNALAAAAFLVHDRTGIRRDRWRATVDSLRQYLAYRQAPFSTSFDRGENAIEDAVDIFVRDQLITVDDAIHDPAGRETIYSLQGEKRLHIDYYKNMIIHYFLPMSFISLSILAVKEESVSRTILADDYAFLKMLFRHEFIFDDDVADDDEIADALAYLIKHGFIDEEVGGEAPSWRIWAKGKEVLKAFAGLMQSYLESYWLVTRSTSLIEAQGREEKDWLREIRRLGLRFYHDGEIRRRESLSQQSFQGAIRFLTEMGLLSLSEKESRKIYRLSAPQEMLDDIRWRIFRYLY